MLSVAFAPTFSTALSQEDKVKPVATAAVKYPIFFIVLVSGCINSKISSKIERFRLYRLTMKLKSHIFKPFRLDSSAVTTHSAHNQYPLHPMSSLLGELRNRSSSSL